MRRETILTGEKGENDTKRKKDNEEEMKYEDEIKRRRMKEEMKKDK